MLRAPDFGGKKQNLEGWRTDGFPWGRAVDGWVPGRGTGDGEIRLAGRGGLETTQHPRRPRSIQAAGGALSGRASVKNKGGTCGKTDRVQVSKRGEHHGIAPADTGGAEDGKVTDPAPTKQPKGGPADGGTRPGGEPPEGRRSRGPWGVTAEKTTRSPAARGGGDPAAGGPWRAGTEAVSMAGAWDRGFASSSAESEPAGLRNGAVDRRPAAGFPAKGGPHGYIF